MTYWTTLWYAGSVVLTMGHEGQNLNECNMLGDVMIRDITAAYTDSIKQKELADSVFPTDQFEFTCEIERLPIDEKYAK